MLDFAFAPVKWLFQNHPESLNPEQDTNNFILNISESFGANGPNFLNTSYTQAVSQAFRESKILVVYLHSMMHDDTNRFCRYNSDL